MRSTCGTFIKRKKYSDKEPGIQIEELINFS